MDIAKIIGILLFVIMIAISLLAVIIITYVGIVIALKGKPKPPCIDCGETLIEGTCPQCTNLCDTCMFSFATCKSDPEFGCGRGNDNVYLCNTYMKKKYGLETTTR